MNLDEEQAPCHLFGQIDAIPQVHAHVRGCCSRLSKMSRSCGAPLRQRLLKMGFKLH